MEKVKVDSSKGPVPLSEVRKQAGQKSNLKRLVIGLVFAASFVFAYYGNLLTVPFLGLALWMSKD